MTRSQHTLERRHCHISQSTAAVSWRRREERFSTLLYFRFYQEWAGSYIKFLMRILHDCPECSMQSIGVSGCVRLCYLLSHSALIATFLAPGNLVRLKILGVRHRGNYAGGRRYIEATSIGEESWRGCRKAARFVRLPRSTTLENAA